MTIAPSALVSIFNFIKTARNEGCKPAVKKSFSPITSAIEVIFGSNPVVVDDKRGAKAFCASLLGRKVQLSKKAVVKLIKNEKAITRILRSNKRRDLSEDSKIHAEIFEEIYKLLGKSEKEIKGKLKEKSVEQINSHLNQLQKILHDRPGIGEGFKGTVSSRGQTAQTAEQKDARVAKDITQIIEEGDLFDRKTQLELQGLITQFSVEEQIELQLHISSELTSAIEEEADDGERFRNLEALKIKAKLSFCENVLNPVVEQGVQAPVQRDPEVTNSPQIVSTTTEQRSPPKEDKLEERPIPNMTGVGASAALESRAAVEEADRAAASAKEAADYFTSDKSTAISILANLHQNTKYAFKLKEENFSDGTKEKYHSFVKQQRHARILRRPGNFAVDIPILRDFCQAIVDGKTPSVDVPASQAAGA